MNEHQNTEEGQTDEQEEVTTETQEAEPQGAAEDGEQDQGYDEPGSAEAGNEEEVQLENAQDGSGGGESQDNEPPLMCVDTLEAVTEINGMIFEAGDIVRQAAEGLSVSEWNALSVHTQEDLVAKVLQDLGASMNQPELQLKRGDVVLVKHKTKVGEKDYKYTFISKAVDEEWADTPIETDEMIKHENERGEVAILMPITSGGTKAIKVLLTDIRPEPVE